MSKTLIITGSVRPNSVNHKIVELVKTDIEGREGQEAQVADLGELNLPFYNGATPPSAENYEITDETVRRWSELVTGADAVVLVSPEYNHGLSAVQKNAIDWLFTEWADKPVAFVAYGWYAGAHSLDQLREISTVIKWKPVEKTAGLQFMKDIALDGSVIDNDTVSREITGVIDQLIAVE